MTDGNLDESLIEEQTSQTTAEDVTLDDASTGEEDVSSLKAQLEEAQKKAEELEEKNKQLFERTKKKAKQPKPDNSTQTTDVDLLEFFGKGGTKEEYAVLQTIMKGSDKSLSEAQEDPIFLAVKEQASAKEKAEQAQLGASGGSPTEKKVDTSKMSKEEHEKHAQAIIDKAMRGN